jgi:hypothetical protein
MMLDEGFNAEDPRYRLAQLQGALLRDVRFIVGIKMHTQGMSVDVAMKRRVFAATLPRGMCECASSCTSRCAVSKLSEVALEVAQR